MRAAFRIAAFVHCAMYRASGGKLGGTANGAPLALLMTRGRKIGRALIRLVAYATDGDSLLLLASVGGMPWNPGWYYNLRADPRVTITIGRRSREMIAEPLAETDRERGWERAVREYPLFTRYRQKVARQIPVVRLCHAPGA